MYTSQSPANQIMTITGPIKLILALVFGAFCMTVGGIILKVSLSDLLDAHASRHWTPATATLDVARAVRNSGRKGSLVPLDGKSVLFPWHVTIAILAYSTLTIAAFHAVLMALQESRLHGSPSMARKGLLNMAIDRLPALLTMEKLLFRLIAFGFSLLTLTVLSGIFFSEQLFGTPFKWDHKTVFTMMSWTLFGALLAGRFWRGWRGKTALRFTLTGFATLLLAYVGSRFVLEVVLHRGLA